VLFMVVMGKFRRKTFMEQTNDRIEKRFAREVEVSVTQVRMVTFRHLMG
jgi:hypothetical protein